MENATNSDYNSIPYWAWKISVYCMVANFIVGLPPNIFVLFHLRKLMKKNFEKFENGAGLPLFVMTINDMISMLAQLLEKTIAYYLPLFIDIKVSVGRQSWTKYYCKGIAFISNTLPSTTTWIWLVLSTMRYLAVRHPLFHRRVWRPPYREIAVIYIISALINSWVPLVVYLRYYADADTVQCHYPNHTYNDVNLTYWLPAKGIWAYWLPLVLILYMDGMIFICRRRESTDIAIGRRNRMVGGQGTPIQPYRQEENSGLWKWLLIASVDILLNAPMNIHDLLYSTFVYPYKKKQRTWLDNFFLIFVLIGEVLFCLQFALNAAYLSLFVYDKNIRPAVSQPARQSIPLVERSLGCPQECSNTEQLHEERLESQTTIETLDQDSDL